MHCHPLAEASGRLIATGVRERQTAGNAARHLNRDAGAIRLAAAKALGMERIPAIDVGAVSDVEAEIIEISEYLHRANPTKAVPLLSAG